MSERFYLRLRHGAEPLPLYMATWCSGDCVTWTADRIDANDYTTAEEARDDREAHGLTPADCRVIRVGPKRATPPASADAAALREVLTAILAGPSDEPPRWRNPGAAPLHAHAVPGRWDRDGSPCAWCALWARAEALVAPPAEKAPPAAPVAPGRADGTADARVAVPSPAARPEGSGAPDAGADRWCMGDVWRSPTGYEHVVVDVGSTWAVLRITPRSMESSACFGRPAANGWKLVSRAGKPEAS